MNVKQYNIAWKKHPLFPKLTSVSKRLEDVKSRVNDLDDHYLYVCEEMGREYPQKLHDLHDRLFATVIFYHEMEKSIRDMMDDSIARDLGLEVL